MTLVYAKKKALTLKKKHKKHSSPSKKSKPQKKSTKKHYGAFKSTHYNPCIMKDKGFVCCDVTLIIMWPEPISNHKVPSIIVMELKLWIGGPTSSYFQKWGPFKHNSSHHLWVTNNCNALFRFSEGYNTAQLSSLCGILQNCAGMPQCHALDPSLYHIHPLELAPNFTPLGR